MTATTHKKGLSPRTIQTLIEAAEPGLWAHRYGLSLAIAKSGTATWTFRYGAPDGKRRLMTLETINSNEPISASDLWNVFVCLTYGGYRSLGAQPVL